MAGIEKKSFDSPDESRTPDKTKLDVVNLGHDAWVIGDDAFVGFEFDSKTAKDYGSS